MDYTVCFFFSSRRRHTRCLSDWSSDVCSSDLEHIRGEGAEAAALTYGFTMVVTAVMFNLTWFYASVGRRLLRPDADAEVVSGITRAYLPGPWIYLGATLVAFASPAAAVVLFMVIALVYVVESSIFGNTATA